MPRVLSEKEKKELALLKASNEMFERTKEECKILNKQKSLKLVEGAQSELMQEARQMGINATIEEINNVPYTEPKKENKIKREEYSIISNDEKISPSDIKIENNYQISEPTESAKESNDDFDDTIQYDVLPLPSKGEPYKDKKSRVTVAYLTASDENFITSPNLYRDGTILDVLLKRKILDKGIDPNLLCKGDRDAIILWLRATGYGNDFPITVKDPKTGVEFESSVDLSTIKAKPFNLTADENGYFDYTTELKKDKIKFKFMNRYDEKKFLELQKRDNMTSTKFNLETIVKELKAELEVSNLSTTDKTKLMSSINNIESWEKSIPSTSQNGENKSVTNSMELAIVSVNGNEDREFIKKYVRTMPALDAFKLRKYISDNEPSLDFKITVERPESLGGGSFTTFLELDFSLFLNIAKL